jgi:signal peptidase II
MRRRFALLALILLILAFDQWTKHLARTILIREPPRHYIGGLLTLVYAENRGAFLSLGANLPAGIRTIVFDIVVAVGLAAVAIVLFWRPMNSRADEIALALIVAGGTGNLIDRIRFRGGVTDFLLLSAGPLHTGIFNLADLVITLAVIWLLFSWSLAKRQRPAT